MDFTVTCTGLSRGKPPDPCAIVIFGVTGDLAHKELIPALYKLKCLGLLPDPCAILGFARRDWTDDTFRQEMQDRLQKDKSFSESQWRDFAPMLTYVQGDFTAPGTDGYSDLKKRVEQVCRERHIPDNILFHLSTPPAYYGQIMTSLGAVELLPGDGGWRRVVIEKPFGSDEASARELDHTIVKVVREEQLYRVDHYLGKETVQNMLVFRFANPGFEPIWNRNYIDHVQITTAEPEGIGTRGNFYEATGVVRDMVQNHLLQMLCMVAMEPPVVYKGDALRNETVKVLQSIRPLDREHDCVLGQYGPGTIGDQKVRGYRQEANVRPDSVTPTFAALKLHLDDWRWSGVPFYLRTGKRLPRKLTIVSLHFKPTPHLMFPLQEPSRLQPNTLTFRLQPDEGILYTFLAKQPGPDICLQPVTMDFRYDRAFGIEQMPSAYQWLLLDAMHGDQTLFPRSDWIYKAWSLIDPLVQHGQHQSPSQYPNYAAGTWGPEAAERLLREDGREWFVV